MNYDYDPTYDDYEDQYMAYMDQKYRSDPLRYWEQFLTDEPATFRCQCGSTNVEVEEVGPGWLTPVEEPRIWVWDCECSDCGLSWDADVNGNAFEPEIDDEDDWAGLEDVPF